MAYGDQDALVMMREMIAARVRDHNDEAQVDEYT